MVKSDHKWLFEGSPSFVLVLDEKLVCHAMVCVWRERLVPKLLK